MAFNYARYELGKLGKDHGPMRPEDIRVKITSEHGETRWLSITPDQLDAISTVLIQGEECSEAAIAAAEARRVRDL